MYLSVNSRGNPVGFKVFGFNSMAISSNSLRATGGLLDPHFSLNFMEWLIFVFICTWFKALEFNPFVTSSSSLKATRGLSNH